ncbi:M1 family peptidase [Pseudoflavitalea sp. G-6-1-2]|uniref:M1 family metallopeptidase n=1 Tax=Pseudoflavitalea sp. G-6-1-2 TaxID=2728841 RepID=UPI001469FF23|nr:M1 family metallopeptidase [Pseudoflavitalea sp. G-6-1-2]NML20619.1 M1 family peptidase [Pseudoflavitalea sp. G-6-1-2]
MKRSIVLLLALCILGPLMAQRPGSLIDIASYKYEIELNDLNNQIQGKATVNAVMLQKSDLLMLDLVSTNPSGKGMTVSAVTENGKQLYFTHLRDTLRIALGATANKGDTRQLVITYGGVPADGLIIGRNKFGHRGFFSDNWPNRARNWIPCNDHPSDKAAVEFIITAPDHYQVVANGVQIEETNLGDKKKLTHYKETVPLPTKIMVIGAADFAVQYQGDVNCIPVYSWIYPDAKEKGFYDYALAKDILAYFIKLVGPYAYKKLANVQSTTMFGGMENASAIFYAENSVTGTRKCESLIAHEIAHQWFGNMATEADWSHLWLSEGFATYMTIWYFENTHGTDTATFMRKKDREAVLTFSRKYKEPVIDKSVTDYLQLLNANSYQKGGWVLHMLRRSMGDSAFLKGVRNYYSEYAGKNATTEDLQRVMEQASGKNFKRFFQQWLYTSGQPVLNIRWKYDAAKQLISGVIEQQQNTAFEFPVDLAWTEEGQSQPTVISLMVKDKTTTFSFPVKAKPAGFVIDPGVNLLYEGSATEEK